MSEVDNLQMIGKINFNYHAASFYMCKTVSPTVIK